MITREDLLKIVIIDLGFPPSCLKDFDDLTLEELKLIHDYKLERERQYFELLQGTIITALKSAFGKKYVPVFPKPRTIKTTKEEKAAELSELERVFGGLNPPKERR